MVLVIAYLISLLALIGWLWSIDLRGFLPQWLASFSLAYQCALIGAIGGIVYCLRAVYLNRCIRKSWDKNWTVWYLLRPIVSLIIGLVAFVFLKAGLLILDADHGVSSSSYGFLALSFIAGLNVDRFLVRIEEIARSSWGIRPSRASEKSELTLPGQSEKQNNMESDRCE